MNLLTTTSGIHRDRFQVMEGSQNFFSQTGSTGQMRLASLIFRTAQMAFFEKKTGGKPLILVDDVLLELDHTRRAEFLRLMQSYSQAFFTFLPEEQYFSSLADENALVYTVDQGRFISMKDKKTRLCKEGEPLEAKDVLDYVLRRLDIRPDNPKAAVGFEWQKIIGNRLYPHVKIVEIKHTTLVLKADHPSWAQITMMQQKKDSFSACKEVSIPWH